MLNSSNCQTQGHQDTSRFHIFLNIHSLLGQLYSQDYILHGVTRQLKKQVGLGGHQLGSTTDT